jgi:DNA-binding beta-propeller fold protein YncE
VEDVSVRQADGVTWAADPTGGSVAKISDGGRVLKKVTAPFEAPAAVSVNQNDGCCWLADPDKNRVYRLDADANIKVDKGGFNMPNDVSCYSQDGSCWVADTGNGRVVKLGADGSEKFSRNVLAPLAVAVDERNGDCWVACATRIYKYSASGSRRKELTGLTSAFGLDVNPGDGSVAVADMTRVVKYGADGNKKWEKVGFTYAIGVAVNKDDGSVWVSDMLAKKVVKLSSSGQQLLEVSAGFNTPMGIDVHYQNP